MKHDRRCLYTEKGKWTIDEELAKSRYNRREEHARYWQGIDKEVLCRQSKGSCHEKSEVKDGHIFPHGLDIMNNEPRQAISAVIVSSIIDYSNSGLPIGLLQARLNPDMT